MAVYNRSLVYRPPALHTAPKAAAAWLKKEEPGAGISARSHMHGTSRPLGCRSAPRAVGLLAMAENPLQGVP